MKRVVDQGLGIGGLVLLVGCGQGAPEENLAREAARLTAPTQVSGFALLSSGHVTLGDRTVLTGGHIGVSPGTGDSVTEGSQAIIALGKSTLGQRVVLKDHAQAGDLFTNSIGLGSGATYTSQSPYATPPAQPPIVAFTAGTTPLTVNSPMTVAAGNFAQVTVNSTLTLSGGTYQFQNLTVGNNAVVQASAASVVRVAGKVSGVTSNFVHIGPTGTQPAGNFRLIVAGTTDTNGGVTLGTDARVTALVVSRASFSAADRFVGKGALAAKNVTIGNDASMTFQTGFECNADTACDDGNPCTTDACVDAKCVHPAVPNGTACPDDGNVCTTDSCSNGTCTHPPGPNGTACPDDGNVCTADSCSNGMCAHPAGPDGTACPSDGNECTIDQCAAGTCSHPPVTDGTTCTDDGNVCTSDACASGVCAHPAVADGTACADDGDTCTTDACSAGACDHPTISGCAVVGPDGGSVQTDDGGIVLSVPPGALGSATQINLAPAPIESNLPYSGLVSGTLFDFEPHGLEFAAPATVTIKYDPATVPAGIDPAKLVILSSQPGEDTVLTPLTHWEERPSSVNTATAQVTGTIEHFSGDGVGQPVASIEIDPTSVALIPDTSQAVNVALFGADGTRLEHVIDWTSDDPSVATAGTTVGLDQAIVTSPSFGNLGETTVTATVRNGDPDPDVTATVSVKVALGELSFENAVSSHANDGVNDARTIGYSYSGDLGIPAFWGSLNPFVSPMTATLSALTYRGQELTVIDGPYYGLGDNDQGGATWMGQFSGTHGWTFITGLKYSTMHLEPGDVKSMTYNHDTGHVMRYVRGTCTQRLAWTDIFQGISDAAESGLICQTKDILLGLLNVERMYFMAQPHFRSEVGLSDLNEAPMEAGFFIEGQYDARVPVINAGVTVGVNPGYSITRRADGFVDVALINDAPNVQVVNDVESNGELVSDTVRKKLRTQVPEMFAKVINDKLLQPIPAPFGTSCDPAAADAAQTCYDTAIQGMQAACDAGVVPEACIADQVLTPGNFLCPDSGVCSVHPTVMEVNVLPEELELVFAPNPFLPTAQIDRFFHKLSETFGIDLCGPAASTDTRVNQSVAGLQLGDKSIDTPPIPCP